MKYAAEMGSGYYATGPPIYYVPPLVHQIDYGTTSSPWEPPKILPYPNAKNSFIMAHRAGTSKNLILSQHYHQFCCVTTPATDPSWRTGRSPQILILIPTLPPLHYGGKYLYQFLLILSYHCHQLVVPLMGVDDCTHPLSDVCEYLSPLPVTLKL
jgi:hypothetical protein